VAVLAQGITAQQERAAPAAPPVWQIDLTQFGYQGRPPVVLGPADNWGFGTYQQGVVFTKQNVVAVFFVVADNPSSVPPEKRKSSPSDPFRLVAIFLDAARGELIKTLDWPLPTTAENVPTPLFFPTASGGFAVGVGKTLSLYSSSLQFLARYDAGQTVEAIASPAGDTILVADTRQTGGQWISQLRLLDTDRLAVIASWTDEPRTDRLLWGDQLAWLSDGLKSIYLKSVGTPPRQLVETKQFCPYWSFINKDTLAIPACAGYVTLSIVSTSGKTIRGLDLGLEQMDGAAVASRNGRRFAFSTYRWGSGPYGDPDGFKARVFDSDTARDVLTVEVPGRFSPGPNFHTPSGDTRFGWGGLALSPDAQLLAVKSGSIVDLYRLPGPGRSQPYVAKGASPKQQPARPSGPVSSAASSALVQEVLSWLPADTQTVIAANGPFHIPVAAPWGDPAQQSSKSDRERVTGAFRALPFTLFGQERNLGQASCGSERSTELGGFSPFSLSRWFGHGAF
jgi:hypothetical protein